MAAQKKKVGVSVDQEIADYLDTVVERVGVPGIKSTCVEAALVTFFRLTDEQQQDVIRSVRDVEITGGVSDLWTATQLRPRIAASRFKGKQGTKLSDVMDEPPGSDDSQG